MRRAVFLDRDGTIIEDVGHPHRLDDMRLLPGVTSAIRALNKAGYLVIIVTNQSAVARGLLTEEDLERIHFVIGEKIAAQGARVDAWYYCPHYPGGTVAQYSIECDCRKPAPGMILKACHDLGVDDLAGSWMVGDSGSDIDAGRRAGVKTIRIGTEVSDLQGAVRIITGSGQSNAC